MSVGIRQLLGRRRPARSGPLRSRRPLHRLTPGEPGTGGCRGIAGLLLGVLLAVAPIASAQTRYVAFGDSITAGVGDPEELGYPPRLEVQLQSSEPGATVENAGVPGETTAEGLSRLDDALAGEPGVLLLMEGTNDVTSGISVETILFNLEEMMDRAEAAGWGVVPATIIPRRPGGSPEEAFRRNGILNRELRERMGERGLAPADPFEVFGATPDVFSRYYSDLPDDKTGHPNGDGYELMASVFRDVIVGFDSVPPVTGPIRPLPGAEGVAPDAAIEVSLWDFGEGIDTLNTELLLDDRVVPTQVTGGERHLELVHRPEAPLSGVVQVRLRTRDLAAPVNVVDREVARFVVEGSDLARLDLDGSGRIDGVDLVRFALTFGAVRGQSRYTSEADFDGNGTIDGQDLARLAASFGETV